MGYFLIKYYVYLSTIQFFSKYFYNFLKLHQDIFTYLSLYFAYACARTILQLQTEPLLLYVYVCMYTI